MLSAGLFSTNIASSAPELKGADWLKFTNAVGKGIHGWIVVPANVVVRGNSTGVAGAGAIPTGKLFIATTGVAMMASSFTSQGLVGGDGQKMSKAIALGFTKTINAAAEYYGASAGVGNGADVSNVVFVNSTTLVAALKASLSAVGINGGDSLKIINGIASGIYSILSTATGVAAVTGSPSPIPATGTTVSAIR